MLIALLLLAADVDSPQLTQCMATGAAAQGQTQAMIECAHAEYLRRDALLNTTYRDVLSHQSPGGQCALILSERRWIARRDATCRPHLGPDTGSLGGLDYEICMADETAARTDWVMRQG